MAEKSRPKVKAPSGTAIVSDWSEHPEVAKAIASGDVSAIEAATKKARDEGRGAFKPKDKSVPISELKRAYEISQTRDKVQQERIAAVRENARAMNRYRQEKEIAKGQRRPREERAKGGYDATPTGRFGQPVESFWTAEPPQMPEMRPVPQLPEPPPLPFTDLSQPTIPQVYQDSPIARSVYALSREKFATDPYTIARNPPTVVPKTASYAIGDLNRYGPVPSGYGGQPSWEDARAGGGIIQNEYEYSFPRRLPFYSASAPYRYFYLGENYRNYRGPTPMMRIPTPSYYREANKPWGMPTYY